MRLAGLCPISPKMLVFLVIAVTAGCGLAIAVSITASAWIRLVWLYPAGRVAGLPSITVYAACANGRATSRANVGSNATAAV